jgi:hypothetical protein
MCEFAWLLVWERPLLLEMVARRDGRLPSCKQTLTEVSANLAGLKVSINNRKGLVAYWIAGAEGRRKRSGLLRKVRGLLLTQRRLASRQNSQRCAFLGKPFSS